MFRDCEKDHCHCHDELGKICTSNVTFCRHCNEQQTPDIVRPNSKDSICIYCKTKIGLEMKCAGCGTIDPPTTTFTEECCCFFEGQGMIDMTNCDIHRHIGVADKDKP